MSSECFFSTACGVLTVTETSPWVETFENYIGSGEQPFICWEPLVTDGVYHGPFVYCGNAPSCHSGSNSAEMKGSNNLLVLPEFNNNVLDLRLSFWATATNTNSGILEVGVVTDMNNPNSFVVLDTCGAPGHRGWSGSGYGNLMGPYDFNAIASGVGRIALRYTNTNASASWNLDDFKVELIPDCPSPVKYSVTASNVGNHSATISFTDNLPDHNSWTVYYKPSTDNVWFSVVTNNTSVDIFNLDASTTYDVYVVSSVPPTNPLALTEKRKWVEQWLGVPAYGRLIITNQKHLLYGDYLIDAHQSEGASNFMGTFLRFGEDPYKTWEDVLEFFSRLGGQ